jgi:uncharacterized lipoprotein NlpE involved in copper resistance
LITSGALENRNRPGTSAKSTFEIYLESVTHGTGACTPYVLRGFYRFLAKKAAMLDKDGYGVVMNHHGIRRSRQCTA